MRVQNVKAEGIASEDSDVESVVDFTDDEVEGFDGEDDVWAALSKKLDEEGGGSQGAEERGGQLEAEGEHKTKEGEATPTPWVRPIFGST